MANIGTSERLDIAKIAPQSVFDCGSANIRSVIGFNEVYFSPHTNPPLTTVSQPAHRERAISHPENL
jgi:hypothetical protein